MADDFYALFENLVSEKAFTNSGAPLIVSVNGEIKIEGRLMKPRSSSMADTTIIFVHQVAFSDSFDPCNNLVSVVNSWRQNDKYGWDGTKTSE